MNLLNKLTIKNLVLNKKRTIVTIIGIVLSTALIVAVSSMYYSGINSLINYEIYEQGNFHVVYYDVPKESINDFENNQAIKNIYLTEALGYAKIDSKNEYKPYAFVKAFTKDSLENLSVKLIDGRFPLNDSEILIPTHLKTNGRLFYNIGDEITLKVGKRIDDLGNQLDQFNPYQDEDEKIINTKERKYKIVGIIERPATNIESYSAPGYTFITYLDNIKEKVSVYAKYNKYGLKNHYKVTANIIGVDDTLFYKVNKGDYNVEEFDEYAKQMENAKYLFSVNQYLIDLELNPITTSSIGGLNVVAIIVCLIIVVTSVFCIKNSFDISTSEKIRQYGMLKSIGSTKKQIKKNVFYEAFILGIVGIPLGIISGLFATYILIIVSNFYLKGMTEGLTLKFSFSLAAILISVILSIITIYFSSFKSAFKASKITPIEGIKNSSDIKFKSNLKTPKFIEKIFKEGGVISYKNIKRNKKKYRTTVISVIVSTSVFIALSYFMNMAFTLVNNELNLKDYNVSLSSHDFKNKGDEKYKKYIDTTKLDNIERYTISRTYSLEFSNPKYNPEYISWIGDNFSNEETDIISIRTLGDTEYKRYIKSLGLKYENIKDFGILVDTEMVYKIDENGKIKKRYMRLYDYNNKDIIKGIDNTNIEIGYVTDTLPFGFKGENNPIIIFISDEMYDKLFKTSYLEIYYKSLDASKLQDNIEEYLKGETYNLDNIDENVKIMNNLFTLVAIFLYGFIIVISLIGITNIFNTITTSMSLRKREFAMLKSIGMTSKEFNRMIRLESLFLGLKSLFFGIPIGLILSYLIYYFLKEDSGIKYEIPYLAIIISVIVVFILIMTLMKYSIGKISKQNTIETIRNENI